MPTRSCRKRIGPGEVNRTMRAITDMGIPMAIRRRLAPMTSTARFTTQYGPRTGLPKSVRSGKSPKDSICTFEGGRPNSSGTARRRALRMPGWLTSRATCSEAIEKEVTTTSSIGTSEESRSMTPPRSWSISVSVTCAITRYPRPTVASMLRMNDSAEGPSPTTTTDARLWPCSRSRMRTRRTPDRRAPREAATRGTDSRTVPREKGL